VSALFDDREEAIYGWKLQPEVVAPTIPNIRAGRYHTWDDIQHAPLDKLIRFYDAGAMPDLGSDYLTRSKSGANAKMTKRIFGFYPPKIRDCLSFHSGRGGCFITRVWLYICSSKDYTPAIFKAAMLEATMLLGWKEATNPTWWYDKNLILKSLINYSVDFIPSNNSNQGPTGRAPVTNEALRIQHPPLTNIQRNILSEPRFAHKLNYNPSITDDVNADLLLSQQALTGPVLDKMVNIAVDHKIEFFKEERRINKINRKKANVLRWRYQVSRKEAIKTVFASFYHRTVAAGWYQERGTILSRFGAAHDEDLDDWAYRYIPHSKVQGKGDEPRCQDLTFYLNIDNYARLGREWIIANVWPFEEGTQEGIVKWIDREVCFEVYKYGRAIFQNINKLAVPTDSVVEEVGTYGVQWVG
jgi:hypothetical protein